MSKTISLKPSMTEDELKEWVNTPQRFVNKKAFDVLYKDESNKKVHELADKAIEKYAKKLQDNSTDDVTDDGDDTPTNNVNDDNDNNGDDVSTTNTNKNARIQPVPVNFKAGGSETQWIANFDIDERVRLDQLGFTQLLHKMMENHVIYDSDRKIFWVWNSKRWVMVDNKSSDMLTFAMQAVDIFIYLTLGRDYELNYDREMGIYQKSGKPQQGDDEKDDDFKLRMNDWKNKQILVKKYNQFITFIQKPTVVRQSLDSLKALMGQSNIEWDNNDYLLNVSNGVVNLKNGELMKHDKKLHLTRIADVDYVPGAKHPVLDRTLSISFQKNGKTDEEMVDYVRRQCGYFLIGGNPSERLFLWHGPTARNGKSVIAGTVSKILGSERKDEMGYAKNVPVTTFLSSRFGEDARQADPVIAGLAGVRLALASEPDKGSRLSSGKVKEITGDRTLTARFLHQDPSTFVTKFKILMLTNFLPASDGDSSIKRRMAITPFDHHISEGSLEDDPRVMDKLWNEREGVLAWMVEGAIDNYKLKQQRIKEKADLIKKVQSQGKTLDDVKERVYEDPLVPAPLEAQEAVNAYIYSANSVSQFLHSQIMSKHDYWCYLYETVIKNFNPSQSVGYDNWNDNQKESFDQKYFKEQYLIALPDAYILRSNLFKMYQNYCTNNGIKRPATAHNFYEMTNRYLVPAHTHRGDVYLGVCATPQPSVFATNERLSKVDSPDSLKTRIYNVAYAITSDHHNWTPQILEKKYVQFDLDQKEQASGTQIETLAKSVSINDDLYFGRMIGTRLADDIDFEDEAKRLSPAGQDSTEAVKTTKAINDYRELFG